MFAVKGPHSLSKSFLADFSIVLGTGAGLCGLASSLRCSGIRMWFVDSTALLWLNWISVGLEVELTGTLPCSPPGARGGVE